MTSKARRIKCRWLSHSQLFAHAIASVQVPMSSTAEKFFVYFVWQFCPVPIKRLNRNYEQKAITAGNRTKCVLFFAIRIFTISIGLLFSLFLALCCYSPFATCQRVKASARRLTASTCFSNTRLSSWLFIATGTSYDLTDAIRLCFGHDLFRFQEFFNF